MQNNHGTDYKAYINSEFRQFAKEEAVINGQLPHLVTLNSRLSRIASHPAAAQRERSALFA